MERSSDGRNRRVLLRRIGMCLLGAGLAGCTAPGEGEDDGDGGEGGDGGDGEEEGDVSVPHSPESGRRDAVSDVG